VNSVSKIPKIDHSKLSKDEKFARRKIYEAVQRADEVFTKSYTFNTLIAGVMEAMNSLDKQTNRDIWTEGYWNILNILEPIAPHIAWELSENFFERKNFGELKVISETLEKDEIGLGVSINGKRRTEIFVSPTATKDEILKTAKENAKKWIDGKNLVKEIYVPNKLVNLVVK
jgi:leucyl-tRNA synthetase